MTIKTEVKNGIRIIKMDDGKLNCLAAAMRAELLCEIDAAATDADCKAVVLIGNDRGFSAGADLKELDNVNSIAEPTLHDTVLNAFEAMPVPVIAALDGSTLGGGLELALACHYRIATAQTLVGLPEVTLGIMPGAGGTQRLPRAVGLEAGLNMMLSGKIIPTSKAANGLIDKICQNDLLEEAIEFAHEVADRRPLPRLIDQIPKHSNPQAYLQFARGAAKADPRRVPGVGPIIDAVSNIYAKPIDVAFETEFQSFRNLALDPKSLPFRYAFLSERKVAHIPDINAKTTRDIQTAAIIGAGTMGAGIAIALVQAGLKVILLDQNTDAAQRGLAHCTKTWARSLQKGRISAAKRDGYLDALSVADDYSAIKDCDLVIEAVVERMDVKKTVFKELDRIMKPGAILATNTSTLDVNAIAAVTKRPSDVVGLHFFSPANIMKLLEIVRGDHTADDVLATGLALAKRMRKVPVVAGVCDGFIANRMIDKYIAQAMFLVEEGASPAQVDKSLEAWGMAMGPFRMNDIVGNDIYRATYEERKKTQPDLIASTLPLTLCDKGWLGQKSGLGWYDYRTGARRPVPNPQLTALIDAEASRLGLTRRKISTDEIVQRCIFAMVNEAAAILEEGIAQRGSDIDMAYLFGFGFPRFRGGPLFFADQFGLSKMLRQMSRFATNEHGDQTAFRPHPLLTKLAEAGKKISTYEATT